MAHRRTDRGLHRPAAREVHPEGAEGIESVSIGTLDRVALSSDVLERVQAGQDESEIAIHSADPDAGYCVRPADSRDQDADSVGRDKIDWGLEATFGVSGSVDPEEEQEFPNLVMGMRAGWALGYSPGKQGARVLASLAARGYEAGMLAADRAFRAPRKGLSTSRPLPRLSHGLRLQGRPTRGPG